jgi:hypothetical protein
MQCPQSLLNVGIEIFTAVNEECPLLGCGTANQYFGRIVTSIFRVKTVGELGPTLVFLSAELQKLVTANVFPSSLILSTLMMEAKRRF